jgi:hypothetical protein
MTSTSAWFLNIKTKLNSNDLIAVFEQQAVGYSFKVQILDDSCWLVASWAENNRTAFRLAYSPNDPIVVKNALEKDGMRLLFASPL